MYELSNEFERALAYFGTRVEIICALEISGKIDSDTAYQNIKLELKSLRKIRKKVRKSLQQMQSEQTTEL
jgi:hypothetical protein